ncbi:MAG TPA: DNA-binding protein [Bacteroidales bacterium]|nr:DNA-binding protein [Bacteroidales bacterium]
MKLKFLSVLFLAATMLIACNAKPEETAKAEDSNIKEGVIKEVIHTTSYTYLYLDNDGTEYWVAVPRTEAEVGKTVYFEGAMEMFNFESKELNRTFDFVYFAQGVRYEREASAENAMGGMQGMGEMQGNPHEKVGETATGEREAITVAWAKNAIKLNELFAKSKEYEGKKITVTGKVVKFNKEIMGKNWVHIQDGTGETANVDLTITTLDAPEVGSTVTFEGKLFLNKDFGSGYTYEIIMEEAKLVKTL